MSLIIAVRERMELNNGNGETNMPTIHWIEGEQLRLNPREWLKVTTESNNVYPIALLIDSNGEEREMWFSMLTKQLNDGEKRVTYQSTRSVNSKFCKLCQGVTDGHRLLEILVDIVGNHYLIAHRDVVWVEGKKRELVGFDLSEEEIVDNTNIEDVEAEEVETEEVEDIEPTPEPAKTTAKAKATAKAK